MRPIPRVLFLTLSLVLRPCSSTPPPTWTEWNADSSSSPKDKQAMDLMSENRDENLGWITGSSNSLTPADRSFVQRSSVGTNTKHNVDMKHQVNLKRQVDALFTNTYSRFRKQKAAQRFFERLLHDFPMSAPRSKFEPGQVDKQSVQVFQQKGRRAIHLGPLPRSSWKQIRWTSGSNPHHAREEVLRRILSFFFTGLLRSGCPSLLGLWCNNWTHVPAPVLKVHIDITNHQALYVPRGHWTC